MKDTEILLNSVFEEVELDNIDEIEAGELASWQCSWLSYCCIHGLIIGSSASGWWPGMNPDTSGCDAYNKCCK